MRQTNLALALLSAAVLSACGGSDNDTPATPAKPVFASQVSFGDSLSDVGTYKVGLVAGLNGGKYTINGPTAKNWTEIMAASFNLAAPCPAQTGLTGDATFHPGVSVPITLYPNCTSYAMGGARVTNPKGPGSALAGSKLGQLTVPITAQVDMHLERKGGTFSGNEVVYVMAGGNDALQLLADLTAAATAAGAAEGAKVGAQTYVTSLVRLLSAQTSNPQTSAVTIGTAAQTAAAQPGATSTTITMAAVTAAASINPALASQAAWGPMTLTAQAEAAAAGATAGTKAGADYAAANGPGLVPMMAAAGKELSDIIRTKIVGKGAKYVVLVNLPDLASSPSAKSQSASSQQLIAGMVNGFNIALRVGIDGLESTVLPVDLFTISQLQAANGSAYGFTNTTTAACGTNLLGGTSLVCNATNTLPGVDVSKYMFADSVHPTPYANELIAKYVAEQMTLRGWK